MGAGKRNLVVESRQVNVRWGMGDIFLGIPYVVIAVIAGTAWASGVTWLIEGEITEDSIWLLVITTVFSQVAMFTWPIVVSAWKGRSMSVDWGFSFRWTDVPAGIGLGFLALFGAGIVSVVTATALGIDLEEMTGNTEFMQGEHSAGGLIAIGFMVVVGAPFAEEVFFRGLVLRSVAKRWGSIVGVVLSTATFTVIHFVGAGLGDTVILFATIGTVGACLGVAAVLFDRLGPSIIMHMTFNGVAFVANAL